MHLGVGGAEGRSRGSMDSFDDISASERERFRTADDGTDAANNGRPTTAAAADGEQKQGGALAGLQDSVEGLGALDPKTAEREAALSANIKVGYRAPRAVKPHGWLRSASMMGVETWLSCTNWSALYGFHQSLFWHISGSKTYPDLDDNTDPVWFSVCVCVVFLIPTVLELPPVLRLFTARHNNLSLLTVVLLMFTILCDFIPNFEAVRTCLLGVASASVMLSIATIMSCPSANPRLRRLPWALVLGLLVLLCLRFAMAADNPMLQAETTNSMVSKIFLSIFGVFCACCCLKEGTRVTDLHPEEEMNRLQGDIDRMSQRYAAMGKQISRELGDVLPDDYRQTFEQYANLRSKLQMYKLAERDHEYGRHTRQWLWLFVGPSVAAALTLSLWLFTDASFLQRCVGGDAFRHSSVIPILAMAVGTTLNGLLTVHGIALQIWAVACLILGIALLLHSVSSDLALIGATLVALALPSVWWVTMGMVRKLSVHGAVGRVFLATSATLWLFLQLHQAAIRGTESAVFGEVEMLRGDLRPFGWTVVGTWSIFIMLESGAEFYFNFFFTADKVAAAKRLPLMSRLFTLHKQSLWKPFLAAWLPACAVGGGLALVLLSSTLLWNAGQLWKQSVQETVRAISGSPNPNTWRFTVATLNVAGGYDTSGMDNVACVRHLLQGLRTLPDTIGTYVAADPNITKYNSGIGVLPLVVGLQESEASVNCHCCHREITSSLARDLHLHAYDGRIALDPARAGLGTLSQLPLSGRTIAFAAQDSGMQRTFTHTSMTLRGNVSLAHLNTQTSYSTDGAIAAQQIVELSAYANTLSGPVVITADFNLFADGYSVQKTPGNTSAWAPLLASGFSSVTPLSGPGAQEVLDTDGTTRLYYKSPLAPIGNAGFTSVSTGSDWGDAPISTWHFPEAAEVEERPGYQTDFIWYRGLEVSAKDANVPGGWRIAHNWRWEGDEDGLGLGRWDSALDNTTNVSCTHHRPLVASFVLTT